MYKFEYSQTDNDGVHANAFDAQFPTNRCDDVSAACEEVLHWAIFHKEIRSIHISDDAIRLRFVVEKDPRCAAEYLYTADVEFTISVKTNDMRIESANTSMNALACAVVFFKDPREDESGDSGIIEKMKLIANRG